MLTRVKKEDKNCEYSRWNDWKMIGSNKFFKDLRSKCVGLGCPTVPIIWRPVLNLCGIWRKNIILHRVFWLIILNGYGGSGKRGPDKFFLYEIVANKISSIDVDKAGAVSPPSDPQFWLVDYFFYNSVRYVVLILICVGWSGLILPPD